MEGFCAFVLNEESLSFLLSTVNKKPEKQERLDYGWMDGIWQYIDVLPMQHFFFLFPKRTLTLNKLPAYFLLILYNINIRHY